MVRERNRCRLDDFELDVETLDERHEKAIVRHEFPGRDGADIEDLGARAREITLRAHFLDSDIDKVESFLWYVRQDQEFELVHPKYGILRGRVESTSTHWDDSDDTTVDLVFVEQYHEETSDQMPNVLVEAEAEFAAGQRQLMAQVASDFQSEHGADGLTVLGTALVEGQSILSQITGVGWATRRAVSVLDSGLAMLSAVLTDVSNPADSVVSAVNYTADLPGRVIGAVARTIERYGIAAATVAATPSRFVDSMNTGVDALRLSVPALAKYITSEAALYAGVVVARLYDTDEMARDKARTAEGKPAFDVLGNYLRSEPVPEIFTIDEIERSLAATMALIQSAVDENRASVALKRMARCLVDHVNRTKLERQRIKQITIHGPQPLHLICHNLGLGYQAADRVLALNPQIHNPNFVDGTINVYA